MMEAWFLVVATGFMGSFHCAAMCGPFVGFFHLNAPGNRARQWTYQAGRLSAYLMLGTVAGLLGRGALLAAGWLSVQRGLMVMMGTTMILTGIAYYLPIRPMKHNLLRKPVQLLQRMAQQATGPERGLLFGLGSALLPCGFLYAYVLAALASGHPLTGLLTMAGFWLGTLPALLLVGKLSQWGGSRIPAVMQRFTPLLLILLGILAVSGKWTALPQGGEGFFCVS